MSCLETEVLFDLFLDYQDGEIENLPAHLRDCTSCAEAWENWKSGADLGIALGVDSAGAGLSEEELSSLVEAVMPSRGSNRWLWGVAALAAAAVLFALVRALPAEVARVEGLEMEPTETQVTTGAGPNQPPELERAEHESPNERRPEENAEEPSAEEATEAIDEETAQSNSAEERERTVDRSERSAREESPHAQENVEENIEDETLEREIERSNDATDEPEVSAEPAEDGSSTAVSPAFHLSLLMRLGRSQASQGFHQQAILTFQRIVSEHPDSGELGAAHLALGRSFRALGLLDEARRHFIRAERFEASRLEARRERLRIRTGMWAPMRRVNADESW